MTIVGKKWLLFLIALIGIILWNMPDTIPMFTGTHSFYKGSAPCEKCHGDINITIHTNTTAHGGFSCAYCHRSEPNVTYASNTTEGMEAHAASLGSCYNCHADSLPDKIIAVNAKVQDVVPANASVIVDVTVQLMNFSGAQNSSNISRVCICNDTDMTVVISNAYADYFKVYIDMSGAWDLASLNVAVDGYPSVTINASDGSMTNFYNLPIDLPSQYSGLTLFHTRSNYTV